MTSTLNSQLGVLDPKAVAEAAQVTLPSLRVLRSRSIARSKADKSKPWDIPDPDAVISRTPVWKEKTIEKWLKKREEAGLHPPSKRRGRATEKAKSKPEKKRGRKTSKEAA